MESKEDTAMEGVTLGAPDDASTLYTEASLQQASPLQQQPPSPQQQQQETLLVQAGLPPPPQYVAEAIQAASAATAAQPKDGAPGEDYEEIREQVSDLGTSD